MRSNQNNLQSWPSALPKIHPAKPTFFKEYHNSKVSKAGTTPAGEDRFVFPVVVRGPLPRRFFKDNEEASEKSHALPAGNADTKFGMGQKPRPQIYLYRLNQLTRTIRPGLTVNIEYTHHQALVTLAQKKRRSAPIGAPALGSTM
jgi:type IV secretory pathway VirB9-like protein